MSSTFVSAVMPPSTLEEPVCWFLFNGYRLLVYEEAEAVRLPCLVDVAELGLSVQPSHYLGYFTDGERPRHCFTAEVDEACEAPEGMAFMGLRGAYGRLPTPLFWIGGRAVQIVDWDRTHRFCGRCGQPTELVAHERGKKCSDCGLTNYPRLSPAIIVAVTRDNGRELLLARGPRHRPGFYSVLAGFVEPGETLEECVQREVYEEVGITVKNISYFASQPWPFPNSLMLAFTAEYDSGDIVMQVDEIEDAGWYTADNLPNVPPPLSVSRALIDDFVTRSRG
jgi:NAD+ diphosphatase